jgi:hypothetical protein
MSMCMSMSLYGSSVQFSSVQFSSVKYLTTANPLNIVGGRSSPGISMKGEYEQQGIHRCN